MNLHQFRFVQEAARRNLKSIGTPELEEARDKVRWGRERRSMALTEEGQRFLEAAQPSLQGLEQALPVLPETMAVSDGKPENLRVHVRGSHLTLAQVRHDDVHAIDVVGGADAGGGHPAPR